MAPVTPSQALVALVARLTAAGMVQARSPVGVGSASSQRVHRSFSVLPVAIGPSGRPDRGRPNAAGTRVVQTFTVALAHQVKPADGQADPVTALDDLHTVWASIAAQGTTLTTDAAITIRGASHVHQGGGAFLVTTFPVEVVFNLDLS